MKDDAKAERVRQCIRDNPGLENWQIAERFGVRSQRVASIRHKMVREEREAFVAQQNRSEYEAGTVGLMLDVRARRRGRSV